MIDNCVDRGYKELDKENAQVKNKKCNNCGKLDVHNWLQDIDEPGLQSDLVEIRFKNTRKGYFKNVNNLRLEKGDVVAVEASPGHDIGIVSMVGELVRLQAKKNKVNFKAGEPRKIYRKAKPTDIDKWQEAMSLEHKTMLKSRKIAEDLKLNMKIGDVEYQGDKTKAIFYYIADDRVDFRQLIKRLADEFKIRVEMRQIGARQEAGRIGGVGPCGRELCCSSWMSQFISVTTNSARYQEVSLNPQKLAGQCSKLKCCLNYELDVYLDEREDFPNTSIRLETEKGTAYHFKTDVFKRLLWYSYDNQEVLNPICLSVDKVKEIIQMNKKGKRPDNLDDLKEMPVVVNDSPKNEYANVLEDDSITRFDNKKKPRKKRRKPRFNKKQQSNNKRND